MRKAKLVLILSIFLLIHAGIFGEDSTITLQWNSFPQIKELNGSAQSGDAVFRQYQKEVENARAHVSWAGKPAGRGALEADEFTFYRYTLQNEDFMSLYARCNVGQAAIATLNHLAGPEDIGGVKTILLPSVPGLYISDSPKTDLEKLLASQVNKELDGFAFTIAYDNGSREGFFCIPGGDFNKTLRAFFLNPGKFAFPLKEYTITSHYGSRINPITGNLRVHQGLDLAAPAGTPVYPTREGEIIDEGYDDIYGNYIIIKHDGNWASLYGHLEKILAPLHFSVKSTTIIGRVGSTGQSTGPHLHFE
ncbi:MAG: M23 family metallopeptidase [Spirochaetaceae bacterium]|nr:M23 family metallopeptidase [Spirochaetaceae bacterium]